MKTNSNMAINKTKQTTRYTHILNSTERNEQCLKIEKELSTINKFRYTIYCYEYKHLYLIKHLYGGVHIM